MTAPELTDLPAELTLANGRSAYQPPSGPRYATHGHLRAERALAEAAIRTGAPALTEDAVRGSSTSLLEKAWNSAPTSATPSTAFSPPAPRSRACRAGRHR